MVNLYRCLNAACCLMLGWALLVSFCFDAQACCAGSGPYSLPRLQRHEAALLAVTLRTAGVVGLVDVSGRYAALSGGSREVDLRQTVTGVLRLAERGQLGINFPFVETYRATQNKSGLGGGIADISLSARYDFTYADWQHHPAGFAVTALVTAPVGVSPQRSQTSLLDDITGTGAWQATVGLTIEYAWRKWLASGNATLTDGLPQKLGPLLSGFLGLAYSFETPMTVSMTLTTSQRLSVGGREQGAMTLVISAFAPIDKHFRLQGSILGDVPALGKNTQVTVGANATVVFAWL